jgi:hypothetical protein
VGSTGAAVGSTGAAVGSTATAVGCSAAVVGVAPQPASNATTINIEMAQTSFVFTFLSSLVFSQMVYFH